LPAGDVDSPLTAALGLAPLILSFDVEEHHRIEAASGVGVGIQAQAGYHQRMREATEWILDELAQRQILATFFILGQIAKSNPKLVAAVSEAGHEVASHGWDHRRIHLMTPETFREDVRTSKDALEQACGTAVLGYRAPTFSIVRQTAWALDVLVDLGLLYDSSIYPVRHDRYGVPDAPRCPFVACGREGEILELPPATLRVGAVNVPIGGGGYFRLLPFSVMKRALSFSRRDPGSGAVVLYFHPWEFDPDQPRLPLGLLNRFRTYIGIQRSRGRLRRLFSDPPYLRAVDLARNLVGRREELTRFRV
jgi:polysaccharide deacetylase family protein (PEP-CTERM system associated)